MWLVTVIITEANKIDDKSLELLEFPRVKDILAGFASFSASRELALNLQPAADPELVSRLLRQSAEARHLLASEPGFSIGGAVDIRAVVKTAALGKVLEPPTLGDIQNTLAATRHLRTSLSRRAKELPRLWSIAEPMVELPEIEKEIGSCISPTGEVLDTASARLLKLRQQLKEKRQQLLTRFEAIVKSRRSQTFLQEPLVTERDGRYVIPVKAEMRREIKGIVHDISNTGATVFMEPWTTVELGNELRQLVLEEKQEVERILTALSNRVGEHEAVICNNVALVAEVDLALAKARYAARVNAVEPHIVTPPNGKEEGSPARVLRLVDAQHPLLKGRAVPLSVEIGRDFSIMVITGPNTGGKTVALKTMGLLTLMAQAGIPIPAAAESSLPIFDGVFADIGDEQSIEQTLSTFSWHIGNIVRIIENATERSLVLLDELGTSTDPNEGSALARSILLHFLSRGTIVIATTHFSELKAFAHATPRLQNASLDFDPVTLAPTYHLTVGIPGGSNALGTASRLGVPFEIISRAKEMLAKGTQDIEALLADLMGEKQRLEALRHELEKERQKAVALTGSLETERRRLREEQASILRETRDRLVSEAAELQKLIREATSELKKARKKESIAHARQALEVMHEQLEGTTWQVAAGVAPKLAPGNTVRITDTSMLGTVVSLQESEGQVEVQAGNTRLRLNLDSVERVEMPASGTTPPLVQKIVSKKKISLELDLRGKRADEIVPEMDSYLNDASLANLSQVRIIHGFGTGTVRQIVRQTLASHPLVKSFRSGTVTEGGDGATVVNL